MGEIFGAPMKGTKGPRPLIEGIAAGVLIALGVAVAVAGLARAFGLGGETVNFDETTLTYLVVAGALVILPRVRTIAFRDVKLELQELKEKAQEAQEEAAKTRGIALATAQQTFAPPTVDPRHREAPLETAASAKVEGTAENDPWKGVFGGSSHANGRSLSATVEALADSPDYFLVKLVVEPGRRPLKGEVMFFLHDTFPNPKIRVRPDEAGRAELNVFAWGAFTVGVLCDEGRTELELDLAKDVKDAPAPFTSR